MTRLKFAFTNLLLWLLAFGLTSLAVKCVGDSPVHVMQVLLSSAFGTLENLSYTLFYATPMLLAGTAVSIALEAGLFNIGAEGQLYMGTVAAAFWGIQTRESNFFVGILGGVAAAFLGGAFWGSIAGYLRTRRHVHEVIATIMMNFIAMAFANWVVLNPLKNPETQNLETLGIGEAFKIPRLWHQTTWGFPLSLILSVVLLWAMKRTWWGFRIRATGSSESAARTAGISVTNTALFTMALSGGVAGLVGFNEVFMNSYRMFDGFSPGYGFTGLAIALLARGSISGLVMASVLFGALHKGALDLDLETEKVTRDLSAVIQALILVALAAQPTLRKFVDRVFDGKAFGRKASS